MLQRWAQHLRQPRTAEDFGTRCASVSRGRMMDEGEDSEDNTQVIRVI